MRELSSSSNEDSLAEAREKKVRTANPSEENKEVNQREKASRPKALALASEIRDAAN